METINLRLLRRGRTAASAFTPKFSEGMQGALSMRPWPFADGAVAYLGQIYSKEPNWADFLRSGVQIDEGDLSVGGAGAAIFLPTDNRIYVICFGHIHIALDDDAFERGFGLKVVLNSVSRRSMRTLDLATPDAVTFQRRVQASRDSDLHEFGVDMLRDLARVAGGTPSDLNFAKFAAGKDSLSLTCDVSAQSLALKCHEVGKQYRKKAYQKDFSWIDNLKVVVEHDLLMDLDAKLFAAIQVLRRGGATELHMAPPEVVSYTEGNVLHYNGFGSHGVNYHSLSAEDYASELNEAGFAGGIDEIKKHRISAQGGSGSGFSEKWRVYDCFVYEVITGSGAAETTFVLFAGQWYRVAKGFKQSVEAFFDAVEKVDIIGETSCANEEKLIEDIDANRADLYRLDQEKINPQGLTHAFIEPCDFLSLDGDFIHLKDGHSSGPISHLWNQGLVSAEALVSDVVFRRKLKALVRKRNFSRLLPGERDNVDRAQYRIVFGVMRKPYSNGNVDLPFFSKVSFQSAAEKIQRMGFRVAIELISKNSPGDV